MMMFQYEKDLKNTTTKMRQIPNSEYSNDIKKPKVKGQKKAKYPVQLFLSDCNILPVTQAPQHS